MCCCRWVYLSYLSKYSSSDLCDAGSNDRIIYVLFMHHPLTGSDNTFFVCGICFSTTCQLLGDDDEEKSLYILSSGEIPGRSTLTCVVCRYDHWALRTQLHDWAAIMTMFSSIKVKFYYICKIANHIIVSWHEPNLPFITKSCLVHPYSICI